MEIQPVLIRIEDHVVHDGKGKTRTTKCAHCHKQFASRSKDRWRQHMRGCESVPHEARRFFASMERRPQPPRLPPPSTFPSAPSIASAPAPAPTPAPASTLTAQVHKAADPVVQFAGVSTAARSAVAVPLSVPSNIVEVLLIQGPCSYVNGSWTGGGITKSELLRKVQKLAAEAEVSLVAHESNHEGKILDWLLNAKEGEVVVLCWVGKLSDSPNVVRALEVIKNRVVVVSPKSAEHGPLPPSVVGVLSGFGHQSLELALAAAKNLCSTL